MASRKDAKSPRQVTNPIPQEILTAEGASISTTDTELLFKFAEKVFLESLDAGRDFSKGMITLCSGLFPVYLGFSYVVPSMIVQASVQLGLIRLLPGLLLILALLFFIASYFPATDNVSLTILSDIARARNRVLHQRRKLIILGTFFFVAAQMALALVVVKAQS